MATRVQIVVEVKPDGAEAGIGRIDSALKGLGATAVEVSDRGVAGFRKLEQQGLAKAAAGADVFENAVRRVFGSVDSLGGVAERSARKVVESFEAQVVGFEKIEAARDAELAKARAIAKELPELRDLAACANYRGDIIRCPGGRPMVAAYDCPHCGLWPGLDGKCGEPRK